MNIETYDIDCLINLTPHPIKVWVGAIGVTIDPSGYIARVETLETPVSSYGGLDVVQRKLGKIDWGIKPQKDTRLLVSSMVLSAINEDEEKRLSSWEVSRVFAPDTGLTAIRENGRVVGVTRLIEGFRG